MTQKRKPKFKIGDVVVITMYGTVGTVTKYHHLDQFVLYEVNHGDILYFENTLKLYSEYEGSVYESEQLEVVYNYGIGDLVHLTEYEEELFKIIGFRTEIWRYKEDSWEEVIYELVRIRDGEWLEASEEEMAMVMSQHQAEVFLQHIQLHHFINSDSLQSDTSTITLYMVSQEEQLDPHPQNKKEMVNALLDLYNDYKSLYEWFGDQEYQDMMNYILEHMEDEDFWSNT
ncbi:hypothetical protein LC087_03825 [Bacillus carboniphilus]|uniref:YodN n=1 Tax=Bacillus carboniphilus TaxID=86663 RepID=A0ABY9JV96_9BACI|nr:hypothetical protein [Bacillus carboniphilus]WLR43327.1 hypothetical protein LC087_03825 [Bacillus carboniphilus]